jgi:hypothetical protein
LKAPNDKFQGIGRLGSKIISIDALKGLNLTNLTLSRRQDSGIDAPLTVSSVDLTFLQSFEKIHTLQVTDPLPYTLDRLPNSLRNLVVSDEFWPEVNRLAR